MAGNSFRANTGAWDALVNAIDDLADKEVQIGVFQEGKGAQSVPDTDLTIADLAAIHEYGSRDGHVPARSFLRSTMVHQQDLVASLSAKVARGIANGKITAEQGLGLVGQKLAAEVKTTIRDRRTMGPRRQENAAETIRAKGSSTPLVDVGQLINAVTYAFADANSHATSGTASAAPSVDSGTASDTAGGGDGGGADS